MKTCSRCGNAGEFCKDSKSKDGLQSQCKTCKAEQVNVYLKANPHKRGKLSLEKARTKALKSYYKHRIARNISRRMRMSLQGSRKSRSWQDLVEYSLDELKIHLEANFLQGMTWDNYGDWHIDHIKPISSFNITSVDCEDFKQCWTLNNLQPLWKVDNLKKGNKF